MIAMASDIHYFVLKIIGLGLGPLTVVILSDDYANQFGDDNLRYAMATTLTFSLLGAGFLWMGVRGLKHDLEASHVALSLDTPPAGADSKRDDWPGRP